MRAGGWPAAQMMALGAVRAGSSAEKAAWQGLRRLRMEMMETMM